MLRPKCDHVLTRRSVPFPPSWLYMESNDLSLRQCGVRSITSDICDIACIRDMHLHGVNLSVKPSRRQDIHITLRVERLVFQRERRVWLDSDFRRDRKWKVETFSVLIPHPALQTVGQNTMGKQRNLIRCQLYFFCVQREMQDRMLKTVEQRHTMDFFKDTLKTLIHQSDKKPVGRTSDSRPPWLAPYVSEAGGGAVEACWSCQSSGVRTMGYRSVFMYLHSFTPCNESAWSPPPPLNESPRFISQDSVSSHGKRNDCYHTTFADASA
ncbi:hypothetical protein F2P81_003312 [Scophthalmus maximus]|uniref:Uncharacterized protein n=1 Tax=Scophthalmus maximus TaxID=52904 RepID=A0A6A4TLR9_SCOMX|nr:hypothetical protein F2P81_003312 [Scophthalmus maximus]